MPAESAAENTAYLRRIVKLEPDEPHASEAPRSIAKATRPAPLPIVDSYGDDDAAEAAPVPLRTSRRNTEARRDKIAAQAAAPLRGTMMANQAVVETETATQQEPEETPSLAASFSVAQWTPQTEWAALEGPANVASPSNGAAQAPRGEQ
jgi:hypothetical protein